MNQHPRIPDDVVEQARQADCLDVAKRFGAKLKKIGAHEHVGPCPACGGTDRFSVNTQKNVFNCRMSGTAGDAIHLWKYLTGCNFADAVCALTGYAIEGTEPPKMPPPRPARPADPEETNSFRRRSMREAYDLWRRARDPGDLVRGYFEIRAIPFPDWPLHLAIREVDDLPFWHTAKGDATRILHRGPAMLAAITGPDGKFIGLHRTWIDLSSDSGKPHIVCPVSGEILNPKKVLGSMRCGKICLRPTLEKFGATVVVGEGIETTLSWAALHGEDAVTMALWCGVSLGNIAGKAEKQVAHPSWTFVTRNKQVRKRKVPGPDPDWGDARCLSIPADFDRVILLGDGDSDPFTTRVAMRRAKARHEIMRDADNAQREVQVDFAPPGKDWNDVIREAGAE